MMKLKPVNTGPT